MTKGLLLIGAGGHARSCIEAIESASIPIFGLIDQDPAKRNQQVFGYPVLGNDADLPGLAAQSSGVLIAVGQIGRPKARIAIYQALATLGIGLARVYASSACVSHHASVGQGSIVMHQAAINAGAKVGENCIINTSAIIEHDVNLGDHCHVATGAIIAGDVSIGACSFIGAGSIVLNSVSIGPNSIIGAGCVVVSDLSADTFMKREK